MTDVSELAGDDPFDLMDEESERLRRFFAELEDWTRPTRCAGWAARELLAHLVGVEAYNLHSLDGTLDELFAQASEAGVEGMDAFNDWQVRRHAGRSTGELAEDWWAKNSEWRGRVRRLGRDGTLQTSVGPYPAGLQAFHLASEYATHADDLGIAVPQDEVGTRTAWRARFSRFAVREAERPAEIEVRGGTNLVRAEGEEIELSDAELVEAVSARLPDDHPLPPRLRDALRALA